MKKAILTILAATSVISLNVNALVTDSAYFGSCQYSTPASVCAAFSTTSLPTMIIANEQVDYNSAEGKALLIQEATNVLEGKKSLILKDDAEGTENRLTAIQKAQIILENNK